MTAGRDDTAWSFVEQAPHEAGFSEIWQRDVAPHLARLARIWQDRRDARRRRRRRGFGLAALTVAALPLVIGGGILTIPAMVLAGAAVAIATNLVVTRPRLDARPLRDLLVAAACEHLGGLTYQRVAARRVEFDHHAELALVPPFETALVEDFFAGGHRGVGFRMIEAELRGIDGRRAFHGLLLEIDWPLELVGRITIAHRRGDDRAPLPGVQRLGQPPGRPVVLKAQPLFHRRFDVFADDEESARALLTPGLRGGLDRLADHWPGVAWQAGHAWGKLLVAVPGHQAFLEPASARTLVFEPVADARTLLEELRLPHRLIDILHGFDPETGRRVSA